MYLDEVFQHNVSSDALFYLLELIRIFLQAMILIWASWSMEDG